MEDLPTVHEGDRIVDSIRIDTYVFSIKPDEVQAKLDQICLDHVPEGGRRIYTEMLEKQKGASKQQR